MDSRLWVDKHRPSSLEELDYNDDMTQTLKQLSQADDLPHIVIYGPPGIGKKTRAMALLNEIYGKGVQKITKESWKKKINSTEVELTLLTSKFHIDLTPSDVGHHDKTVVQTLIKETASNIQLNPKAQKNFMTIIFNESEKLSKEAQASLRRTMEKYVTKCRLILLCSNLGNLIPALLSRCLLLRCRGPTEEETTNILKKVGQSENLTLEISSIKNIIANSLESGINLRRAIFGLQNLHIRKIGGIKDKVPDWHDAIKKVVENVKKSQTPATLKEVRVYDLLVNCIDPGLIIRELMKQFMPHLQDRYRPHLIHWAAHYENLQHQCSKELPCIEAFLSRVMVLFVEQNQRLAPMDQELGVSSYQK